MSPLIEIGVLVRWDGPFPVCPPSFLNWDDLGGASSLRGTARLDRRRESELRTLYKHFTGRRGNDFWRGAGSLPANADRIQTALAYLQSAARQGNVFESHVSVATCLEALVGPENQQDISRRVSSRTALLAGAADQDVGDVFEHVRGVYDLRSRILHTGTVLDRDATRIRNRMMPSRRNQSPPVDGGAFVAPRYVSLEVGRRAVVAALRIELRLGEAFDPERLDRADIDWGARRALNRLTRPAAGVPIRDWVEFALSSDFVRPRDLALDTP